jgi:Zn-dependent protease
MVSKIEVRDLSISIIALALAFSMFNLSAFPENLIIIILVFAVHEMAHKFVAQRYGCFAEYRMWPLGIVLALLSSLVGVIFAAPGATYISPYNKKSKFAFSVAHLTKKEYGKISLAGPATNIAIGSISLALSFAFPLEFLLALSEISFFLAFFNLLPIFPLDGSKVLAWDKRIWLIALAIPLIGVISLSLI